MRLCESLRIDGRLRQRTHAVLEGLVELGPFPGQFGPAAVPQYDLTGRDPKSPFTASARDVCRSTVPAPGSREAWKNGQDRDDIEAPNLVDDEIVPARISEITWCPASDRIRPILRAAGQPPLNGANERRKEPFFACRLDYRVYIVVMLSGSRSSGPRQRPVPYQRPRVLLPLCQQDVVGPASLGPSRARPMPSFDAFDPPSHAVFQVLPLAVLG